MCTASPEGYFLWVNSAFEQTLGYTTAELIPLPFLELVHLEDRAASVRAGALLASGVPVTNFDNRYRCADGTYKWLNWTATQDAQGIVYASARDITAQKAMQANLSRLAPIAASTTNAVVVTDLAGRIEWVNEGFTRTTGYVLSEAIGRKPGHFLQGPDTDPAVVAYMRSRLAADLGFSVEILNYSKTGRSYWNSIDVQPLLDSEGRVTGYMAIQLDVTARKLDELRLRQGARVLARMSELSKIGAWEVDLVRMVPVWSEQVYHIHELAPSFELELKTAINFYHPSVRVEVESLLARGIQTGEGWDREWPLITAKGNAIWVRSIAEPQFENGLCIALNGTFQDITVDRQRLERIRQSELRQRELLTAIPDALLRIGPSGHLLDLHSPPGFPPLTDPSDASLLPPVAHAIDEMLSQSAAASVITSQCELALPADTRTLELRLAPAQSDDSRLVLVHDITERKAAEVRLATAAAWQSAFHDFAGFSVIASSPAGLILSFNRSAEAMLGYSAAEMIDCRTAAIFHDPEEIVERAAEISAELGIPIDPGPEVFYARARLNFPNTSEWSYIRKDGSRFPGLLSVTALRNPAGEVIGFLGVAADITVQKEAARQLVLARQAAEDASQAKSDFLANMSHEIRTPLNGIIGFTNVLADTPLSADQREYVNTLSYSAEALLDIVNDILDFSKIEAGRMNLESIRCDVRQTAVEVCELLSPRFRSSAVELVLDWNPSLPRFALGDPGRIRQVLLNLVGNSIKFTETGSIVIHAEAAGESALRIAIVDTGIGIEASKQGRLFSDFAQVDSSAARRFGGTGLGLAISRRLIEAMGGKLEFVSTFGVGSEFSFQLPASPALPAADPPTTPLPSPPRVLIVDDLPAARRVVSAWCESWNWPHQAVASAAEAAAAINETTEPFTLAFIDASLPDATPEEVATRLGPLPLVILAPGPGAQTNAEKWLSLGYAAVLPKPLVRPEHLLRAVTDLLNPSPAAPLAPTPQLPTLHRHRILVAEDNPVNQTLALLLLKKLGCQVDLASDGLEAVALAADNSYDLIFMDCQMPKMDGFAATAAIRARSSRPPIVALTANALLGDRERCLAAGMNDYLTKPFHFSSLERALTTWIKPGPAETAAPTS